MRSRSPPSPLQVPAGTGPGAAEPAEGQSRAPRQAAPPPCCRPAAGPARSAACPERGGGPSRHRLGNTGGRRGGPRGAAASLGASPDGWWSRGAGRLESGPGLGSGERGLPREGRGLALSHRAAAASAPAPAGPPGAAFPRVLVAVAALRCSLSLTPPTRLPAVLLIGADSAAAQARSVVRSLLRRAVPAFHVFLGNLQEYFRKIRSSTSAFRWPAGSVRKQQVTSVLFFAQISPLSAPCCL